MAVGRSLFFLGGASVLSGLEAYDRIVDDGAWLLCTPRVRASGAEKLRRFQASAVVRPKPSGGAAQRLRETLASLGVIASFVARHGPFDDVILGDLSPAMRMAALCAQPARVTVVDDGIACLTVGRQRQAPVKSLFDAIFDPPQVRFFSAFPIAGRSVDEVEVNDYRELRRANRGRPIGAPMVVGQPFVDTAILTLEHQLKFVHEAADIAGEGATYAAHPNESQSVLSLIAERLPVVHHSLPLELHLQQAKSTPRCIVGFYSSVLPQAALLFGGSIPVTSLQLPPPLLLRARDVIEPVYALFAEQGPLWPGFTLRR